MERGGWVLEIVEEEERVKEAGRGVGKKKRSEVNDVE